MTRVTKKKTWTKVDRVKKKAKLTRQRVTQVFKSSIMRSLPTGKMMMRRRTRRS